MVDPIPGERTSVDTVAFGDPASKGGPVTGQETDVLLLAKNVKHTVDSHTDSIDRLLVNGAALNATLQSVQADVQSVQADVQSVKANLVSFKEEAQQQFEGLHNSLGKMEVELKDMRAEMNGRFDDINCRFDDINGRFDALIQSLNGSSLGRLTSPVILVTPPVSPGGIHPGRLRNQYGSLDGVRKYTIQVFEHVRRKMRSVPDLRSVANEQAEQL